jgi:hypothetical protein
MDLLHCDEVEITEWYDGLVQGFIRHSKGFFYAILLAWNVDLSKRLYLVIPLETADKDIISAAYSDPNAWPAARQLIENIIRRQYCYFSGDFPDKDKDIHLSIAANLSNSDLLIERFMINQATTEQSIHKWLK